MQFLLHVYLYIYNSIFVLIVFPYLQHVSNNITCLIYVCDIKHIIQYAIPPCKVHVV